MPIRLFVNILTRHQFLRFCVVGGVGFMIDAGLTLALLATTDAPFLSRLVAIISAMGTTWALNRRFTFTPVKGKTLPTEGTQYLAVNSSGAAVNYGIYSLCIMMLTLTPLSARAFIAVCAGSIAGLLINYLGMKYVVFYTNSAKETSE